MNATARIIRYWTVLGSEEKQIVVNLCKANLQGVRQQNVVLGAPAPSSGTLMRYWNALPSEQVRATIADVACEMAR